MIKRTVVKFASLVPLPLRSNAQLALESNFIARATQKRKEFEALLRIVRARKPRVVVEIGTRHGGTFYGLCKAAAGDALLISIDLPDGPFGGGYEESDLPRLRSYARAKQRTEFIRGDSHDPATLAELRTILGEREIDVLFIDGDHTYDGVRMDYDMYAPLVRAGGLVALHDIAPAPQRHGSEVDQLWSELKGLGRTTELIDQTGGDWAGIGVLER